MKRIKKLLVANRSEIAIRVFRAAAELGIRTVAIYAAEDRFCLHRFKADETYQVGNEGEPIKSYLNIDEIIRIALENNVDAIHPGYGFLSENVEFARRCREAGIIFIGPSNETLDSLGDKVKARHMAIKADVPVLNGSDNPIADVEEAQAIADNLGYPVILKAAHGGGGRGMRVIESADTLAESFATARSESLSAFGSDEVFIEKFITRAKHIEVQLLGDGEGNLVHLYERDCSLQRRHQKVVEIAPSPKLSPQLRDDICAAAVKIGKAANYMNAGTVEFLVDDDADKFYFIEVNPRVQVEHTVTEEVTGVDIVKSQILIADGCRLDNERIGIANQAAVSCQGFALQCRITTEDASNHFMPDYGKITHYRSAAGPGIRLDAGSAYSGAVVNPFYDSMLVKVTARAGTFAAATERMSRALREFRVRGVKTNILFLEHLIGTEVFVSGDATTRFIDNTPALFEFKEARNRAMGVLGYLADIIVNGNETVAGRAEAQRRQSVPLPPINYQPESKERPGSRDKFKQLGAEQFAQWIRRQDELLVTDTTMRDAHQSLLATRMRTRDMLNIADAYRYNTPQMFSLEMWGGATFDTSMRFLKESPWERLEQMREKVPNILFQMLLRASSAVGYANYPDNVVKAFVKQSAESGIDIFRIFDALNWTDNMRVAMDAANECGAICEASICYTGDILDPKKTKYDLKYYIKMGKRLEKMGAHIIAIKDMAGLCKPQAIHKLVSELKQEVGLPIHFHTHDTSGMSAASIMAAADAGVDIVDMALASLSGGTSQPNMNTLLSAIQFSNRASSINSKAIDELSDYWRLSREFYTAFESETLPATSDLYAHEMPGGQYTNLLAQARALGLSSQWSRVCEVYAEVNQLFGDIVKVTPSSKAVGDMALFMVANDLTPADILDESRDHAYPESVLDLISGRMGQPYGGFPEKVKNIILRHTEAVVGRAGDSMQAVDFESVGQQVAAIGDENNLQNQLSMILYPKVYQDYYKFRRNYRGTYALPTYAFFHGLKNGEEIRVTLEKGKRMIIKYLTTGEPQEDGTRTVFFELNAQPREINVIDRSLGDGGSTARKADPDNAGHIGAVMPGMVVSVAVQAGETIKKGQKLLSIEAMKMETTLNAEVDGLVKEVVVSDGSRINTGDLLLIIEI